MSGSFSFPILLILHYDSEFAGVQKYFYILTDKFYMFLLYEQHGLRCTTFLQ